MATDRGDALTGLEALERSGATSADPRPRRRRLCSLGVRLPEERSLRPGPATDAALRSCAHRGCRASGQ